ncbi:MAG: SusC/RagA family TonB-linked outer membrane protein [Chitinophagaceae bacterium]
MSKNFQQRLSLLLGLLLFCSAVNAQNLITVEGNVSSKDSRYTGANISVIVQGGKNGTTTDDKGHFRLSGVPANATLVFSGVGLAQQSMQVKGRTMLTVVMESSEAAKLDEVVVIGYGTRTKRDVTGAVAQIKATQLENENPGNVTDVLRGNVAGLSINQTNGSTAKGGGDIQVRGKTTISAGSSPLLVVDGVIYPPPMQLTDINPNDIATIDVLKDASSAAVYGAKSASGVIIITTKKGSSIGGKPTITFNTNFGVSTMAQNQPVYDGPGFVAWRTEVLNSSIVNHKPYQFNDPRTLPADVTLAQWRAYDGASATLDPVDIWLNRLKLFPVEIANYKAGKQTNWYKMMFQNAFRQDHTVSISNRNDQVSYYLSGNYTNNDGVVVGDNFKTVRVRANLEAKVAKFMSVGLNSQFADRDESSVPVYWNQMLNASPYGEKYKADGVTLRDSPNDDIGNNINPFLDQTYTNRLKKYNTIFASLYAKGNLPFGFSYQVNFTPTFEFYRYFNGISAKDYAYSARKGVATRIDQTTYNWQVDNIINWKKEFGRHKFDATFLYNAEKFQSWKTQVDNEGFDPNDNLSYHNIGSGIKPVVSSDDQYSTGDALMGRVTYTYNEKYMLNATVRRDGYSAFGQGNPRGTFPAVAFAWSFGDEAFMKKASWLDYGKLRLSWGINGNRDIGRYVALANLSTGKYQYVKPDGTLLTVSQLYVTNLQNPNLKWEKTTSYNIGLDFSIFKGILGGSIDVYKKQTRDLLITRTVPVVTGFDNVIDNLGQVDNNGIEVTLNSNIMTRKNFSWRAIGTFSLNRNKVVHLYGPVDVVDPVTGKVTGSVEKDDVANRWFIGHDLGQIWDLKTQGIWQTSEATQAAKYGVAPGDFKVQDVNGDGKFSDADRQFLGYRTPRYQWSLRNEFNLYKNIDVSFQIYAIWGTYDNFDLAKNNGGFPDRQNSYIVPYWTPTNPINDYARLFSSNGGASYSVYRETSLIRLNNISVGYTIPKNITKKARIESLKIYANVNNVALYTPHWKFWDPEAKVRGKVFNQTAADTDINQGIPTRTYTIGLNLTF